MRRRAAASASASLCSYSQCGSGADDDAARSLSLEVSKAVRGLISLVVGAVTSRRVPLNGGGSCFASTPSASAAQMPSQMTE
eukprot:2233390-Prymnesium_polylepis.1